MSKTLMADGLYIEQWRGRRYGSVAIDLWAAHCGLSVEGQARVAALFSDAATENFVRNPKQRRSVSWSAGQTFMFIHGLLRDSMPDVQQQLIDIVRDHRYLVPRRWDAPVQPSPLHVRKLVRE